MNNILGTNRNIDMVFCIDGTGSMAPFIDTIKRNARRFREEFISAMTDLGSDIDALRIKFIVFRDYECDRDEAMLESRFFELPADEPEYEEYLTGITVMGGGDLPENGLEALYLAMKSDFVATGSKDRQVIVIFSDADALDLRDPRRTGNPIYPSDMVDMDGLLTAWACAAQDSSIKLRERQKRLVIFCPAGTKYQDLVTKMNRSVYEPVKYEDGLADIDFKEIIKIIAASASNG